MGEASNCSLELLQLRTCRGRWAGRWAELVEGGSIPSTVSNTCKDPKMKEGAGLGAHGFKPQREVWAAEIWSRAHSKFFRPWKRVQPARQNVWNEKTSMMAIPESPKGQMIRPPAKKEISKR